MLKFPGAELGLPSRHRPRPTGKRDEASSLTRSGKLTLHEERGIEEIWKECRDTTVDSLTSARRTLLPGMWMFGARKWGLPDHEYLSIV